jgi:uncharacterized membrane protein YqjE
MNPPPPVAEDGGGMVAQARSFFAATGRYISARARLARLEGKEAAAHLLKVVLMIATLVVLATFLWLFTCLGITSLLAGAFREHGWLWASLIMAGAHLLLILIVAAALKRKAATPLFPLTAEELKKDQAWLEQTTPTKPRY